MMTSRMKKRDLFIGDEYWNESDKRITPFDFDDDSEGYAFMKSFKEMKVQASAEEEEEYIIGWDGKPLSAGSDRAAPLSPAAVAEVSLTRVSTPPSSVAGTATWTAADSLAQALSPPEPTQPPEPAQLAAQVAFLQRRLSEARLSAPPAAETARQLTLGEPRPLELYRSLADKRALLTETARLGDGDALLAVVLFLKRSLKRALFHRELQEHPVACEQYLAYLRTRCCYTEAVDLLTMLGRSEDAAMLRYESAVRTRGTEARLRALVSCLQSHFSPDPELATQTELVRQQIDLIERQRPVEAADSSQLVGTSVLGTLFYCCTHHYGQPANHLASPLALRERHHITEKQYVWTALRARAALQAWADVQALFTTKAWYAASGRLRAVVPLDPALETLQACGAPPHVLAPYLAAVDGADRRIALAKQYGCFRIVVDTYVSQRDRQGLEQFRATLVPESEAHGYASDALRAATVRWKN